MARLFYRGQAVMPVVSQVACKKLRERISRTSFGSAMQSTSMINSIRYHRLLARREVVRLGVRLGVRLMSAVLSTQPCARLFLLRSKRATGLALLQQCHRHRRRVVDDQCRPSPLTPRGIQRHPHDHITNPHRLAMLEAQPQRALVWGQWLVHIRFHSFNSGSTATCTPSLYKGGAHVADAPLNTTHISRPCFQIARNFSGPG